MNQNLCNNCGGEYEYRNGRWVCRACGAFKPEEISNEEVTLLYTAYQNLRLAKFSESEQEFDDIIEKYPQNPNGYWGRLMARYGIKYERDFDGRMIPTCYAASIESLLSASDYKKALQYADKDTRAYYREQAEYMERVRKEWIEKASHEKPYDIFICYKDSDLANGIDRTQDSIAAQDLYIHLTNKGYRVFYSHESLRDKVGEKYEPYIFNALSTAKVMLVYGSKPEYITSTWLKNEWTRYEKRIRSGEKDPNSLLVACEGFSPGELPTELSSRQCFNASAKSFYGDLDDKIDQILHPKKKKAAAVAEEPKKKSKAPLVVFLCLLLAAGIFFGINSMGASSSSVTNPIYNATVEGIDNTKIPSGTSLQMQVVSKTQKYENMTEALKINQLNYKLYDMSLVKNGKTVTPDGKVQVSIPIPTGIDKNKAVIYYMSGTKAEKIPSNVEGSNIVFTTTHFSVYMIAEDASNCDHFVVKDPAVAATCTKDGLTEGSHCSICNLVIKAQTVVKAAHKPGPITCEGGSTCTLCGEVMEEPKGHSYTEYVTAPTCTKDGYTRYNCKYCSYSYQSDTTPATGHTPLGEATCTSPQKCRDCKTVITAALGHSSSTGATCTEPSICDRCDTQISPALGHKFSEDHNCDEDTYCTVCEQLIAAAGEHIPGPEATCTLPQLCLACGEEIAPALGHTYETTVVAPTCDERGYTTYTCHCGDSYVGDYTAPLGHTPGEDATCDEDCYCVVCGALISEGGHVPGAAATCQNPQFCLVCGEELAPVTSHNYYGVTTAPTCTEQGYTTYSCYDCDDSYVGDYTEALGHTIGEGANCERPTYCAVCGVKISDASDHVPGAAATCQTPQTCMICGVVLAPTTNHGFWNEVTLPEAVEIYTALNDSNYPFVFEDGILVSTNHDASSASTYTITAVRAFTFNFEYMTSSENGCDWLRVYHNGSQINGISGGPSWYSRSIFLMPGDTVTFTYSKDGSVDQGNDRAYVRLLTGSASTDVFEFVEATEEYLATFTPRCTEDICCSVCGAVVLERAGHTEVFDERVEPTKTENGYAAGSHCSVCGETLSGAEILYATGSEGLEYQQNGEFYTVIGIGSCTDTEIYIPYYYNNIPVTMIGENAFSEQTHVTKIVIPESVSTIGYRAFYGCTGLTEMTIPANVTDIGAQIFFHCDNLATLTYNSTYSDSNNPFIQQSDITKVIFGGTYIPSHILYQDIEITEIEILDSVTSIGYAAFNGCTALTEVVIGAGVTAIDLYAFEYCSALSHVTMGANVASIGDGAFRYSGITEITIPDGVMSISADTFFGCTSLSSVTFGSGLLSIHGNAFNGCTSLTSIEIPSSVRAIGHNAFCNCSSLASVTLNRGLVTIDSNAFAYCTSLEEIVIPNSVTSMGQSLFHSCTSLRTVVLSDGISAIPSAAFYNCSALVSIEIPDSISNIGSEAFRGCASLMSIEIPDSVTSIDFCAFYECMNLIEVINHSSLDLTVGSDSYGYVAYYAKEVHNEESKFIETEDGFVFYPDEEGYILIGYKGSATEVVLPDSVNESTYSIGAYAFYNRSDITSITIPEGVTAIGTHAFDGCAGLTSIVVPDSVTAIGEAAFAGCSGLTEMTIPFVGASVDITDDTAGEWSGETVFGYIFGRNSYEGATQIQQDARCYVTNGGYYTTYGSDYYIPSNLTKVTVTGGNVNHGAFYNCSMLTEVNLPEGLTAIGESAFYNCSGLTSIVIPEGVTVLGAHAFAYTGLTSVLIPESVTSMNSQVFYGCTGLTEITIPAFDPNGGFYRLGQLFGGNMDGMTEIYQNGSCYYVPSGLTKVTVLGGEIPVCAFENCSMLGEIVLGAGVTKIGYRSFDGCTMLSELVIPEGVSEIDSYAFSGCTGLAEITVPDSVTLIGSNAFVGCIGLTKMTIPFVGFTPDSTGYEAVFSYIFGASFYEGTTAVTQYYDTIGNYGTYYIPSGLTSVTVTGGNINIGAFSGCTMLTEIILPEGLTAIGEKAFYNCSGLTALVIPETVTSVGANAFYGCDVDFGEHTHIPGAEATCQAPQVCVICDAIITPALNHSLWRPSEATNLTLANDAVYPFLIQDGVFVSNNHAHNSSSEFTITAISAITLNLEYKVSSESSCDWLRIKHNGVELVVLSGENDWGTITVELTAGDTLTITYSKDGSQNIGDDCAYVKVMNTDGSVIGGELVEATPEYIATLTPFCTQDICCDVCGGIVVPQTGHTEVTDEAVAPGATTDGLTEGSHCSVCGEVLVARQVIPASGTAGLEYQTNSDGTTLTLVGIGSATDTEIYIPAYYNGLRVTAIAASAFSGNTQVTKITIAEGVESIGYRAFYGCTALTEVTIPSTVTSIGTQIFRNATNLSTLYYNSGYTNTENTFIQTSSVTKVVFGGAYVPAYILSGSTKVTEVVIEDSVTRVNYEAFYGCTALTSITIGNGVTYIEDSAFMGCSKLATVTLGSSLETIGNYAFRNTGITELVIPDSVKTMYSNVFSGCEALTSVTIGAGVNSLGSHIFSDCTSLASVTLSTGMTSIGTGMFYACSSLAEIMIPETVLTVGNSAFYGCTSLVSATIPDGVTSIGYSAFYGCTSLTAIEIPETVASISSETFRGCTSLTSVTLGEGMTAIGDSAFYGCTALTEIAIPGNIATIGSNAFRDCTSLASVTLEDGVMSIGHYAFYHCTALEAIVLPNSVTSMGEQVFYGCTALESAVISDALTAIPNGTFYNCSSLTFAEIPDSIATISSNAFRGCSSLATVTIPDSVTSINSNAFRDCTKLLEVINHSALELTVGSDSYGYVAYYAKAVHNGETGFIETEDGFVFYLLDDVYYLISYKGSATELVLPASINESPYAIYPRAFANRSELTSVIIPEGVIGIGAYAFEGCTGLAEIIVPDSVTEIRAGAFAGCSGLTAITVPFVGASADAQENATTADGSTFFGYIFGTSSWEGTTRVEQYGQYYYNGTDLSSYCINFYIPTGLTSVTITGGSIPYSAFYAYTMLTKVNLGEGVTAIGDYAFYACTMLTEINLGEGVTSIGGYAFYACTALTDVTFGNALVTIGEYAFHGCSSLTSVTIPEGVTSIGNGAFMDCDGLTSVVISNSVNTIGEYAFSNSESIMTVTLGSGVTSIGYEAFYNCVKLVELINHSSLVLTAGSVDYGYVAYQAREVHDGESKLVVTEDGFAFYPTENGWYLIGYTGSATELVLPESIEGSTYKIYHHAFWDREDLTSIVMTDGVTEIGDSAFSGCRGLTSIVIPDSVTLIGVYAFSGCSGLTSVTFGEGLEFIGQFAFQSCVALTSIVIPDNVTTIGYGALCGCTGLTSLTVPFVGGSAYATSATEYTLFGYIFSDNSYDGTTQIYQYYDGNNCRCYYIPSGLTSVTVTGGKLFYGAFYNCTMLTSITLGDGVTAIGERAFYNCSALTEVIIPESVLTIGANAFYGCSAIPEDHRHVGANRDSCSAQTCMICGAEVAANSNHSVLRPTATQNLVLANDFTYPFAIENGIFVSTNHDHSSSATFTITATGTVTLKLEYMVSSEGDCDPLTIRKNSTQLVRTGGQVSWTELTVTLNEGDTLSFTYSKDGSVNTADDCAYVKLATEDGTLVGWERFEATEEFVATLTPYCTADICCDVCGAIVVEHVGHTEVIDEAIAPTKTENGLTEGSHCSVCGEVLAAQETVWATGSAGLAYTDNGDGTATITGIGECTDTEIFIPRYYNDLLVTAIAESAFFEQTQITSFTFLSDNVTAIGRRAFYGCTGLTEMTIPASVTSIGAQIFFHCDNLATLTYHSTYSDSDNPFIQQSEITKVIFGGTSVPSYILYQAVGVTEIEILDTVTTIGSYAFRECTGLTEITVPESVTEIGSGAFAGCSGLTEMTIPFVGRYASATSSSSSTTFGYIFGTSSSYAGTTGAYNSCGGSYYYYIPTTLTTVTVTGGSFIGSNAFQNCTMLTSITLPETITSIGQYAFYNCDGLTSITIPETVTSIGDYAFYDCDSLTSMVIPDSVTSIGSYAFNSCDTLAEVTLPASLTTISPFLFQNCIALESIELPVGVTTIESYAFYGCSSLAEIVLPDAVTTLGDYAFYGCTAMESVTFGSGITTIGNYVFKNCTSLEEAHVPHSVTSMGTQVFYGCTSLKSATISDSLAAIPSGTFYGCSSLTEIEIPDSIVTIGSEAFRNCLSLLSVEIPRSVKAIDSNAFSGCEKLVEVINKTTLTFTVGDSGYGYVAYYAKEVHSGTTKLIEDENGFVFYPTEDSGYLVAYKGSATELVLPDDCNGNPYEIYKYAFYNRSEITSVVIPEGVTAIGTYAFGNCSSLAEITVADSVTSIGASAFSGCGSLAKMTIPFVGGSADATEASASTLFGYIFGTSSFAGATNYTQQYYASNSYARYYIPASLTEVTVAGGNILYGAFYNCSMLTSVTLGDGVTTIGERAFYNCTGLTEIEIPDGVTTIGSDAFSGCSALARVSIGNGVTTIGSYAFAGCGSAMTSLVIPDSVTSIGEGAFSGWVSLTEITIPFVGGSASATSASRSTLFGYIFGTSSYTGTTAVTQYYSSGDYSYTYYYIPSGLTTVTVTGGNILYGAFYGCTMLESITLPEDLTSIGEKAFYNCAGLSEIEIPDSVTTIGSYAFRGCTGLTEIEIPDSVTTIGSYAFSGCSALASVSIGNGVTTIGTYAFYNCTGLTEIEIPDSVTSIGEGAFSGCSGLTEMTIPFVGGSATATSASSSTLFGYIFGTNSYTGATGVNQYYNSSNSRTYYLPSGLTTVTVTGGNLKYGAFSGCTMLTEIVLPEDLTVIGERAFYGCTNLTEITIPDGVTELSSYAFYNCDGLTSLDFLNNVTTIGSYAFAECGGFTELVIPDGIETIGSYAFQNCTGLKEITIFEGVTSIDSCAFQNCTGLTEITVPDSVTSIGEAAFSGCSGLVEMTIPFVGRSATATSSSDSTVFGFIFGKSYFTGATIVYQTYGNDVQYYIPSGLTEVTVTGGNLLYGAFSGCNILTKVILSEGITAIGARSFISCTGLSEIEIPESVTTIGNEAFYRCTNLSIVTFKEGLTSIGEYAFAECDGLTEITIPGSVNTIDDYAFYDCPNLLSVTFKEGLTFIGQDTFGYCSGLTEIVLPDSVKTIRSNAFIGCAGLTSVTIGSGVTSIGRGVFYNYANGGSLTKVNYNGTTAQWIAINKDSSWHEGTNEFTIQCTDGICSKNSTIL